MLLYIPLWYDSNIADRLYDLNGSRLYIPLWYDSNDTSDTCTHAIIMLYIPLWYDSNILVLIAVLSVIILYIPLWYDSNFTPSQCYTLWAVFTFHSGTILITIHKSIFSLLDNFTFHSGTILIRPLFYYRNTLFSSTVLSTSNFILYFASMKL